MIQPLRSALPAVRPSTSALRTLPRPAAPAPSSRKMISAAAYPIEGPQSAPFDLNILDIFDAPSRLGESSKLLISNAAASSALRRARPLSTQASSWRPAVKPLPAPVVLDGPARPRHAPFVSLRFRAFGLKARARAEVPRSAVTASSSSPSPLPPPVIFDGPSQLRPYIRGGARGNASSASSLAMSATPIALALVAGVVLFGVDVTSVAQAPSRSSTTTSASTPARSQHDRLSEPYAA